MSIRKRIIKKNITPSCYICDMDGGKATATTESSGSDEDHRVADGHRGQADAVPVFANTFISATCTLNDRKVMLLILE